MSQKKWETHNPSGSKRVIVTKKMPGDEWLKRLTGANCRVEVCISTKILSVEEIKAVVRDHCDGAIVQLTEDYKQEEMLAAMAAAGVKILSSASVGYNHIKKDIATKYRIPVGNTPDVLTDTTAEMAVALTFAAARRVVEADRFMRSGHYDGWDMNFFLGKLIRGATVGVVGAGRIGSTYAKIMARGFGMNVIYFDVRQNLDLEDHLAAHAEFLKSQAEEPPFFRRAKTIEELLRKADVVSLHVDLNKSTGHLINTELLGLMKKNAVLVNTTRGEVVDETALVKHLKDNPDFTAALDVFEREPEMAPGLADLDNVIVVPHIASATKWTREGMALLAALNVIGILLEYPIWDGPNVLPFLEDDTLKFTPSIINAKALGLA